MSYLINGKEVIVTPNSIPPLADRLPAKVYSVNYDPDNSRFYLLETKPLALSKVYGQAIPRRTDRFLKSFIKRGRNTGVLLIGQKGSGKTMQAKHISLTAMRDYSMPTLLVNETFCGEKFNSFMQSITCPCVVLFDEFEKVYSHRKQDEGERASPQERILTLLDGTWESNKLFIFTANEPSQIDDAMYNRTGRIRYYVAYDGMDAEFAEEYIKEHIADQAQAERMIKLAKIKDTFNYDTLSSWVDEVRLFGIDEVDALECMNIVKGKPDLRWNNDYMVRFDTGINGMWFSEDKLEITPHKNAGFAMSVVEDDICIGNVSIILQEEMKNSADGKLRAKLKVRNVINSFNDKGWFESFNDNNSSANAIRLTQLVGKTFDVDFKLIDSSNKALSISRDLMVGVHEIIKAQA